jgi:Bacterial TniB protein
LATVMNCSPYRVSVKKHPALSREFPYNQLHLVQDSDNELKRYKAVVSQGECRILLRIRQKGHKDRCCLEVSARSPENREERSGRRSIVSAEFPPVPLLRSLYAEIIRSLSADVSPTMRLHELETRAVGMLHRQHLGCS